MAVLSSSFPSGLVQVGGLKLLYQHLFKLLQSSQCYPTTECCSRGPGGWWILIWAGLDLQIPLSQPCG